MAYSRRRNTRSRRPRRGTNMLSLAGKAFRLAKFVAGLVNVEHKYTEYFSTASLNGSTIVPLTLVAQGDDTMNRNGNSIKAASISIKGDWKINSASTDATTCRMIVFIDNATMGTLPSISDLLDDNGSTPRVLQHYDPDFAGSRFTILDDKRININTQRPSNDFSMYHKLHHHVKYDLTTGVIAAATTGHVYIALMDDASSNYPTYRFSSTFRFIDN